jgi:hypothetical protein
MKAPLMHPERNFDLGRTLPVQAATIRQDLALDTLLGAMADGDEQIATTAAAALLNAYDNDAETIRYRQAVVRDVLAHPEPVRDMYATAIAALEDWRKSYWGFLGRHPASMLRSALHVLRCFLVRLRGLRAIAEAQSGAFQSAGFRNLFATLEREFDDAYLARIEAQLSELEFSGGALVSARLGPDCESEDYVLRRPTEANHGWLQRLLARVPSNYTVRVAPRDMIGAKTLGAMRDRGIHQAANALVQSVDHIEGFFTMLRMELAFHVGCLNLAERLAARNIPRCFPDPSPIDSEPGFTARQLRDAALALAADVKVVANTIDAAGKRLVVITGANQGGKSTFLRSVGLAQLMMQAGMFVTADAFAAPLCTGLFTHYKREEDATMQRGKLDEELARIGAIADAIRPGALLLCNESFASTNEREGSELAQQMVDAMRERRIGVLLVTHHYTFAHRAWEQHHGDTLFLRAERLPEGARTFRLVEGEPRATSYGEDLYREVFGDEDTAHDRGASLSPGARAAGGTGG